MRYSWQVALLMTGCISSLTIRAEQENFTTGLEIGAAALSARNTNFGAGRVDQRSGKNTGSNVTWFEGYLKPSLQFNYGNSEGGQFYGGFSAFAALTRGDGDVAGLTNGSEEDIDVEDAYFGWKQGVLDISIGAQTVDIGTRFLIGDGNFDTFDDGMMWIAARNAFRNTVLFQINTQPLSGDLFYLKGDNDLGKTALAGLNLEYADEQYGTFGLTTFKIVDVNDDFNANTPRKGMNVFNLRATELHLPTLPDLKLTLEYAWQRGDGAGIKYEGEGGYAELTYALNDVAWKPSLLYRYAWFSGDNDATDNARTAFDPLYYGFAGYGKWFQGELTGNYLLFNSNQRNHMLGLTVKPVDLWQVGLIYYRFHLNENNYFGTPVDSDHFGDEVNMYVEWFPDDHWYITALFGAVRPGQAAKQALGHDETYSIVQALAVYKF